jgi:hypothetical protein
MSLHLYNAAAAQGLSCYKHLTTVKKPVNIVSHLTTLTTLHLHLHLHLHLLYILLLNAIQLDANRHYPTLIDATPRYSTFVDTTNSPIIRQAIQSSTVFVIN